MNGLKKYILLFGLITMCEINFAQQLNIEQTIDYINQKLGSTKNIEIKNNGLFIMTELMTNDQRLKWEERIKLFKRNPENYKNIYSQRYEANIHSLEVEKSIKFNKFVTEIKCKTPYCLTWTNYIMYNRSGNEVIENTNQTILSYQKQDNRDKIHNAFKYLFGLIKESNSFQSTDDDPFANENFNNTYSYVDGIKSIEEIKLKRESGVYHISIDIGGVTKSFVLDSGASEISLSSELEKEFIARGIIKKESYLEPALYRIADGSIISKKRVVLKNIKVGEYIVNNVTASIGSSNIPLLLGKSFLDKFSKWTIDNTSEKLILEK
ncbi:retroviral-like aspartic protease family protein [Sabulilitoribacter arenilitoris]|uniref:Retroviral-like aspartic protease family protein n=1 Tax=Wocania arenilitoris TaxID=2044858 RepID=A0AAE3ERK8_9FLAO|nr:retropepsin-like aspartic protease [Wocania arenilitoris]MCF7569643.1 retroviral-like aspartic protease family protein [Wocania arenilitoris]